jgi:hypothetical protein
VTGVALTTAVLAAAGDQQPEDVGKSGPLGLLLTVLLLIAVVLLVRSMTTHLKRVPRSFDPADAAPQVPDTPAELMAEPEPGQELLDTLRRAPRAIEGPRDDRNDDSGRSDAPRG